MGAVTRLVIHAVLPTPAAVTTLVHLTIIAGLATTAAVLAVVLERTRPLLAVAFAIFCGAVAAGASWFAGGTAGLDDAEAWRLATAGVALGIAALLVQAWRDNGGVGRTIPKPPRPRSRLDQSGAGGGEPSFSRSLLSAVAAARGTVRTDRARFSEAID